MGSFHHYQVEGMHCASCSVRIEEALRSIPGVESCAVNFAAKQAQVSGEADIKAMETAVRSLGYELRPMGSSNTDESGAAIRVNAARQNAIIALILSVPLLALHFAGHGAAVMLVSGALATAIVVGPGRAIYSRAFRAAVRGTLNMDSLVAMGSGTAFMAGWAGIALGNHRLVDFPAAGLILSFVTMGKYLEEKVSRRTGESLDELEKAIPQWAHRLSAGSEPDDVPATALVPGDLIIVRPGEAVPADGEVTGGRSSVSTALLTGEPLPVLKESGSRIIAGSVNNDAPLTIRVTATGESSFHGSLIRLAREGQNIRPGIQKLADRVSAWFVPVTAAIAGLTFGIWWYLTGEMAEALVPAVTVLVIACPCALGLATPAAVSALAGWAARRGILIRSGKAIEQSPQLRAIVLDKTGTLTQGLPEVVEYVHQSRIVPQDEVLAVALALERRSEHPLARAIERYLSPRNLADVTLAEVTNFPGEGISAQWNGKAVAVGSREYVVTRHQIDRSHLLRMIGLHPHATRSYVAIDGKLGGIFYLNDPIRSGAENAVSRLRASGIEPVLSTGDNEQAAGLVAKTLGISRFHANELPAAKLDRIQKIRSELGPVAMVGDGINDTAALQAADLSIGMGTGTSAAQAAADIVLLRNDMNLLADALEGARECASNIRQNLVWAFLFNAVAIPVAAAGLLPPMYGALAMSLSSVLVVTNALRLTRFQPGGKETPSAATEWVPSIEEALPENEARVLTCNVQSDEDERKLRSHLAELNGFLEARMDRRKQILNVRFDPNRVSRVRLIETVRAAGYTDMDPGYLHTTNYGPAGDRWKYK